MFKTFSNEKYDFYRTLYKKDTVYNIVPKGSEAPKAGYLSAEYILNIKGIKNLKAIDCF